MALGFQKPRDERQEKKSPLTSWLGKRERAEPESEPAPDVAAGLNRVLRGAKRQDGSAARQEDHANDVRTALGAIETALYAIDRIRDTLEQSCEVAISARDIDDPGGRALLAERYDELRLSIDVVLRNADPRAASLIGTSARSLDVGLGGKARYSISPTRLDVSKHGLRLSPPANAFDTDEEIDEIVAELDRALAYIDQVASGYCRDAQYLIARMNGAFR